MNIPGRETANKEDIGGLKLRNQLEQKKDELVILAEGLWDGTWGHGKSEMKNAQYRNLLNAALSTQSIEEVVNFIKY